MYIYLCKIIRKKRQSVINFVQIPAIRNINLEYQIKVINSTKTISETDLPSNLLDYYPIKDIERLYNLPFKIE